MNQETIHSSRTSGWAESTQNIGEPYHSDSDNEWGFAHGVVGVDQYNFDTYTVPEQRVRDA